MNEVVELTKKELTTKEGLVKSYFTALEKCEKSTWKVAEIIHNTVNREDFKKLFTDRKTYAGMIALSPSTVSKMEKAFSRKMLLQQLYIDSLEVVESENVKEYSATQISEISPIEDERLEEFVSEYEVSPFDSCATIRKKVKDFVNESEPEKVEESEKVEEHEEVEETGADTEMYARFYCYNNGIEYAGVYDILITKDKMEKILEILNS